MLPASIFRSKEAPPFLLGAVFLLKDMEAVCVKGWSAGKKKVGEVVLMTATNQMLIN